MNVTDIVKGWLIERGYDGLYREDCGCALEDLMICDGNAECEPGHKIPCDPETCPVNGDCPFHIGPREEKP